MKTFHVYKKVNGEWKFWWNGLAKSLRHMERKVRWVVEIKYQNQFEWKVE